MEKENIIDALRGISYPGFTRTLSLSVSFLKREEQKAVIELELSTQDSKIVEELKKSIEKTFTFTGNFRCRNKCSYSQKQNNGDQAAVASPNLEGVKAIIAI